MRNPRSPKAPVGLNSKNPPQSSETFPGRFVFQDEISVGLVPNMEGYLKVVFGKIPDSVKGYVYEFQDAVSSFTAGVGVGVGEVARVDDVSVTGDGDCCVTGSDFFTKAKYPTAPTRTIIIIIRAMFAKPF